MRQLIVNGMFCLKWDVVLKSKQAQQHAHQLRDRTYGGVHNQAHMMRIVVAYHNTPPIQQGGKHITGVPRGTPVMVMPAFLHQ